MSASDAPAPQLIWSELSPAQRNAAYNNAGAVPAAASGEWAAARDAAAAAYRAAHAEALNRPYGAKPRQKVDLYLGDPAAPWLVFIHGGYWQRNSREGFAHYARGLAAHGWSLALPGYTLAPEARLGDIVTEIGAALDLIARERGARGHTGPLVLSGWSAGAQLAVLHLDHPAVTAGLAISGVYDLGPVRDTMFDAALKLSDAEIATLSPLRVAPSAKPLVVAYGARELPALVHDSRQLIALRAEAGVPATPLAVAGADHFSVLDQLLEPDGLLTRAALELAADGPA